MELENPSIWDIAYGAEDISNALAKIENMGERERRLGNFTLEEDRLIAGMIATRKHKSWTDVAKELKGKSACQCRDRWENFLSPAKSIAPWSREEDDILIDLVGKFGTAWAQMTKLLPGRSENCIKNRWFSLLRRKSKMQRRQAMAQLKAPIFDQEAVRKTPVTKYEEQAQRSDEPSANDIVLGPVFPIFFPPLPSFLPPPWF